MKKYILCFLVLLLFGCSVARVPLIEKKYNSSVDLSRLHTYSLKKTEPEKQIDARYYQSMETTIQKILSEKGYQETAEKPDFLVDARLGLTSKAVNIDGAYLKNSISTAQNQPISVKIEQGDLSIIFIEVASGKEIFRGMAKSEIDHSLSPAKKEQRIVNTVQQMLEDVPARQ